MDAVTRKSRKFNIKLLNRNNYQSWKTQNGNIEKQEYPEDRNLVGVGKEDQKPEVLDKYC